MISTCSSSLTPSRGVFRAKIALDTDRHAGVQGGLVAALLVGPEADRVFVAHADPVDEAAVRAVALGRVAEVPRQVAQRDARPHQVQKPLQVRVRAGVGTPLLVARRAAARPPGPRDIATIAVAADEVGVESHEIARLDHAVRALLIPGIGPRARGQQTALDPLAAQGDALLMQPRPQLLLGDTGRKRGMHGTDGGLAGGNRLAHGEEFLRRLAGARTLGQLLPVHDLHAEPLQWKEAGNVEPIDRESPVTAAVARNEIGDLRRPSAPPPPVIAVPPSDSSTTSPGAPRRSAPGRRRGARNSRTRIGRPGPSVAMKA